MHRHAAELELAREYVHSHEFARLTDEQVTTIIARGRELYHWAKAHPALHNAISVCVILFLLVGDYLAVMRLPGLFLDPGEPASFWRIFAAAALSGSVHSYLLYSLGSLGLHEAASHHIVFLGSGPIARIAQKFAANLARLSGGDPEFYSSKHMIHHSKFATEHDAEFLNYVLPRRYYMTFLPMVAFTNFVDFIGHRPLTYTRSRIVSDVVATVYTAVYFVLAWKVWGPAVTLIANVVFLPHVGFYLDRMRQFTEHNLMPLENWNGARSFGVGFWGLLVGGGPWGSPCHLEHHLVPSIPWYQQLYLHFYVKRLMTPQQREQFMLAPVVGFPLMWWRVLRELHGRPVRVGR